MQTWMQFSVALIKATIFSVPYASFWYPICVHPCNGTHIHTLLCLFCGHPPTQPALLCEHTRSSCVSLILPAAWPHTRQFTHPPTPAFNSSQGTWCIQSAAHRSVSHPFISSLHPSTTYPLVYPSQHVSLHSPIHSPIHSPVH